MLSVDCFLNLTFFKDHFLSCLSSGDFSFTAVWHTCPQMRWKPTAWLWALICPLVCQNLLELHAPGLTLLQAQVFAVGVLFFLFLWTFPEVFYVFSKKAEFTTKGVCQQEAGPLFLEFCFHLGEEEKSASMVMTCNHPQSANPNTNHKMRGIVEVFLPLWVSPHSFWGFCSPWISLYNFIYCDPDVCVKEELNWLSCLPDELRRRQVQGLWKWGPCRFSGVLCLNICFVLLKLFVWQLALNSQYGMSCTECPLALPAGPLAWGLSWLRS